MSGSGGNAFLDLLRALAPAGVGHELLVLLAALGAVAGGLALVLGNVILGRAVQRRLAGGSCGGPRVWFTDLSAGLHGSSATSTRAGALLASALTVGGSFGALAIYPLAPHVFFVDPKLGLFALFALLALGSLGSALTRRESAGPSTLQRHDRALTRAIGMALAVGAGLVFAGTPNLIEASRIQSDGFGVGWAALENPFVCLAALLYFVAAACGPEDGCEEPFEALVLPTRRFLLCAVAAVYFFGGFESPLTWWLRQSLGEDPGFLNHVVQADGSTQTRLAIGGLVFQLVAALTLLAKTWLGMVVLAWLRADRPRPRVDNLRSTLEGAAVPLGIAGLLGAGLWEWARACLWSSA